MKNLFSRSSGKQKLAIAFASFIVLLSSLGILINEESKRTVAITINGEERDVKTHAVTVRELFDELNVKLRSQDYLFPAANTKVKNHLNIVWRQARQVQIVKDNEKKTIWSAADTVAGLLKEQNITLNEHDHVSPSLTEAIKSKMKIYVNKAYHLTYVDGGKEKRIWSTSATVADFLTQQGIRLNEFDRVEPSLTATVKANDVINVIRVEKVTDVVEEPIQFAVVTKKDQSLEQGTSKTIKKGQQGLVWKKYEVILENGKEVSRSLLSEQQVKEKQDQIVAVGSKDLNLQVSRGESDTGREFYVNATAYTADCNGCSGHTATGINLRANPNVKVIAVDPRIIPLGTKVYVEGYGYAVAADTGSAIQGYIIDVFVPNTSSAYRWGRRKVKIKILE